MSDLINRQAMLKYAEKERKEALMMDDLHEASIIMAGMDLLEEVAREWEFIGARRYECSACGEGLVDMPCDWKNGEPLYNLRCEYEY